MIQRGHIKEAAFHLFAYKGFVDTTLQDIAKAVGLQKQSLYTHFPSKKDLYLEITQDQHRLIISELQICLNNLQDESIEDLLSGVLLCLVSVFSVKERLLIWKRHHVELSCDLNTEICKEKDLLFDKQLRDRLYEILSCRYDWFKDPKNFRTFFIPYMLMIQGYLDWMMVREHDNNIWEITWNSFWNGMKRNFDMNSDIII